MKKSRDQMTRLNGAAFRIGADALRKGGLQLLQAFKVVRSAHPTAELYIVGPRGMSIPTEMSPGVVYVGFLSKKDPNQTRQFARILATSSLFVMPSLWEGLPLVPLIFKSTGMLAAYSTRW